MDGTVVIHSVSLNTWRNLKPIHCKLHILKIVSANQLQLQIAYLSTNNNSHYWNELFGTIAKSFANLSLYFTFN